MHLMSNGGDDGLAFLHISKKENIIKKSSFHNTNNVHLIIYHANSLQNQSVIYLKIIIYISLFPLENTHYTYISNIPISQNNYYQVLQNQKILKDTDILEYIHNSNLWAPIVALVVLILVHFYCHFMSR